MNVSAVKKFSVETPDDAEKPASPVIRIAVQSQIGTTKIVTFETFCDQLTPKPVMDKLMDTMMDVADRQNKKYELVDLRNYLLKEENQLRVDQENYERHKDKNVAQMVDGRRLPVKSNPKLDAELKNMATNIDTRKSFVAKLREDIATRETEFKVL